MALLALLVAAAAGAALLLWSPSGTDLTAQQARASFAASHPGAAVDLRWFGGVLPASYSVVAPYVEAVVGARLTGILAAVASAPLLALLLVRWRARRVRSAAVWGALALVADMVSGRTAFALGVLVAVSALVTVPPEVGARRRQWVAPTLLAALTTLTSPVAALFLALVALGWALVRRPVALLAVATALPMALLALLFREPGRMPDTWAVARPVLLACLAVVVLCRGLPVRAAAAAYGVGALVVYLVPSPIGSNVERLALLFTGMVLLAASWLPTIPLVLAVAVCVQWTVRVPLSDLEHAPRLATERAAAHRLVDVLHTLGPVRGRLEVVPFAAHGEANVVANVWPLARGWERQVDVLRARPLYSSRLTADGYRSWLAANAVQLVALGRHAHDWSTTSERRVLAHPPAWLHVVHQDPEWTVWQVEGFTPLVTGATATAVAADRITMQFSRPGTARVDVHWSRWLTTDGGACLRPHAGTVEVVVRRGGTVTLSSSYLAPLTARRC